MDAADPVISAAIKKRDELQQEIDRLNTFIETHRALAREFGLPTIPAPLRSMAAITDALTAKMKAEMPTADEYKEFRRTRGNPKPEAVTKAAVDLIRQERRPMTRRELHKALAAKGLEVRGVDPIKTLGTMLWRSGALVQIDGVGYWPVGDAPPPELDADDRLTLALALSNNAKSSMFD